LRQLQNIILLSKSQRPSILKYPNILSRLCSSTLTVNKRFSSAKDEMLDCDMLFAWMLHQTNEGTCYLYAFSTYIYH